MIDPARGRHVGEPQRARPVRTRPPGRCGTAGRRAAPGGRGARGGRPEHAALHQVDVEVAVVVVVEQRDARRHDLGLVEPAGHPVDVDEVEAARRGPVDEPLRFAGGRCRRVALERRRRLLPLSIAIASTSDEDGSQRD